MVILTDHRVCLRHEKDQVRKRVEEVRSLGVKIVPVAIGLRANLRELEKIKGSESDVIHCGEYEEYRKVGKEILFGKNIENLCKFYAIPMISILCMMSSVS